MPPSRRPVIGISAYVDQARWGVWDMRAVLVPEGYVRHVEQAGALALVVPPNSAQDPRLVDVLDGLVLAGGPDVDPSRFGAQPHPQTMSRPDRDAAEFALLDAARERELPVLGICRGMQVMAVAAGGALIQHLPEVVGDDRHRGGPGIFSEHVVNTEPGSLVASVLGDRVIVNSYHHQGVADPGSLAVTGHAEDGTIEVLEAPGKRFTLGVQWHPEALPDPRLFDALVTAAAQ